MDDAIQARGKAIEDMFFAENDRQLLDKLRQEMEGKETRASLEAATGISDSATLDALVAINITPETMTTVGLIPLVAVAWADDSMEDSEQSAIMQAADISGIKSGTAAYETLENWLKKKPAPELLETWKAYISSLKDTLEPAALSQLKNSIMERAEGVAKSAGGFLGLGNKVSDVEQKVLNDLEATFG